MFSKTLLTAVAVLVLVDVILSSSTWEEDAAAWRKNKKIPQQVPEKNVFKLEGPEGPNSIKTYDDAVRLCEDEGAHIADNWRLRDSVRFRGYEKCGPCGWLKMARIYYKNARPICGDEGKDGNTWHMPCANEPAEEGLDGYDVYCFGKSGPQLPPDAVAINVGDNTGYVFVVENGRNDIYEHLSNASSQCIGRGAIIADSLKVELGWQNGMSVCACGWMENYSGMPLRDNIPSCGDSASYIGCPHGKLRHVYCFVDARAEPRGTNLVSFAELRKDVYPRGIENGAVQIDGGYVYSIMNIKGSNKIRNMFEAYHTCKKVGASVATPEQLEAAQARGLEWCGCNWVWDNAELYNTVMVNGTGAVYKVSNGTCGQPGLVECPIMNDNGDGWNVFCYKDCPQKCPPPAAWNIPHGSVNAKGGRVFHVEGDSKYAFGSKTAASEACRTRHAELATSEQLKIAQVQGLTKCRCGYLADDKVAFPMYRPIEGCGDGVGVFECPGDYYDIPEQGPEWDAYCFMSDQQMASLDNYDETLVSKNITEISGAEEHEEVKDWHFVRPEGMKRVKLEGKSSMQLSRQAKRERDKLERQLKAKKRKEEKERKAKERKAARLRKEQEAKLLRTQERQRKKLANLRAKSAKSKSSKSKNFNPTKKDFHGLTRLEKQKIFVQSLDPTGYDL